MTSETGAAPGGESQLDNIFNVMASDSAAGGNTDGKAPAKVADKDGVDESYIADTFSKFGLNINLLLGEESKTDDAAIGSNAADSGFTVGDHLGGGTKTTSKVDKLLSAVPDFSFLCESTVSMGQLFV